MKLSEQGKRKSGSRETGNHAITIAALTPEGPPRDPPRISGPCPPRDPRGALQGLRGNLPRTESLPQGLRGIPAGTERLHSSRPPSGPQRLRGIPERRDAPAVAMTLPHFRLALGHRPPRPLTNHSLRQQKKRSRLVMVPAIHRESRGVIGRRGCYSFNERRREATAPGATSGPSPGRGRRRRVQLPHGLISYAQYRPLPRVARRDGGRSSPLPER